MKLLLRKSPSGGLIERLFALLAAHSFPSTPIDLVADNRIRSRRIPRKLHRTGVMANQFSCVPPPAKESTTMRILWVPAGRFATTPEVAATVVHCVHL